MKLLGILILSFQALSVNAQDVLFQHIDVDKGLSQNSVLSMIQDSEGFIWFGTEYGLNKYDGYKTEIFVPEEGNEGAIAGSEVWSIMEDSKGRLWVGTNEGVNIFDREHQMFRRLDAETEDGKKIDRVVTFILEADNGDIWFGTTAEGLFQLNESENNLTNYPITAVDPQAPEPAFRIWSIYIDKNEILWAGTWNKGLVRLDTREGTFEFLDISNSALKSNYVGSLYEVSDSTVWVGTRTGMQVLNVFTNEITSTANEELNNLTIVQDVLRDDNGTFWVATYGEGLFLYDSELNSLHRLRHEEDQPHSLSGNLILDLMQDASGCIWTGSWLAGASKYCPDAVKFTCCKQYDIKNVFGIGEEDHYLVLGAYGHGLFLLDIEKEEMLQIRPDPENHFEDRFINSMAKGRDGEYWIGHQGGGLSRFDIQSRIFENILRYDPGNIDGLTTGNIRKILVDSRDRIWLGTGGGGLNLYNPSDRSFRYFTMSSTPSVSSNNVSALLEDSHHNIWIGTLGGGLNKLDPSLQSVTEYRSIPGAANTLSNDRIWDIWEDRDGMIWVATNIGLNSLDPGTGKIARYTEQDGLANNWVYTILEDDRGRLWLSTNKGISVFDVREKRFVNYDVQEGLQSNEFNANAKYKSKDGQIYFGGINGFNAFYPDKISINTKEPNVVFTDLKVLNKPVPVGKGESEVFTIPKHISRLEKLVLSHKEPVISLEFASLHYVNPQKNRYQYKLEGFDNDWIEAGTRNFVTYTNLDAGNYTFRVKGANSDGFWSSEEATLGITVLPPPWKTWWAYSLYGLVIVGGIAFGIRTILVREKLKARLQLEQMELQKAQELDQTKSRFFASISHEFRTPLTLISAPVKELIKKHKYDAKTKQNLETVDQNANRLLELVNQLLDLSKIEAGKLSLRVAKDDIYKPLKIIAASFQSLAESKEITFTSNLPNENLYIYFDKEKIERIVINLLSNAFKFSSVHDKVELITELKEEQFCISVKDTGRGIPHQELAYIFDRFYQVEHRAERASHGSGIGLALVKELTELHHGHIKVKSKEVEETEFTVFIPTQESVYRQEEIIERKPEEDSIVSESGAKLIADNETADRTSDKPLVLVVEDNQELLEYICMALEETYSVEKALNGQEGLEKSNTIPDLIISDLMMPEMDGQEMLQQIRKNHKTNHIPLIMLTAKADRESKLKGLEFGADHYINKPFDMDELRVRVKSLIARRDRVRDHYYKEFISSPTIGNTQSADDQFLKKALDTLEELLSNSSLTVDQFANELAMSRVQLHRKLKAILGCSTSKFIREVRLKKAYQYLKNKKGTVSEIAYEVGFNNLSYFAKCFKETYDVNPSELLS